MATVSGAGVALALLISTAGCAMWSNGDRELRPGFARCTVDGADGAQCRVVEVFENRQERSGRTIALSVVLLPARARTAAPDPLFVFAGGPGQAASSLAGFAAETFGEIRRRRDIVLVDVRGTGRSNPLHCDLYPDLASYFGDLFPPARVRECRRALETTADLRQYATRVIAEDIDEVRQTLGYDRINVYGTSYGTALARVYLARHPATVRAMILKAVAPMTPVPVLSFARDAQDALDLLLADCAADADCRRAFPAIKLEANAVFARFRAGPVTARARDPQTGMAQTVAVSGGAFAGALLTAMQGPATAAAVPALLHDAYHGNYDPAAQLIVSVREIIGQDISWGMHFSVLCTDGNAPLDRDAVVRATTGTFLGDYRLQQQFQACREWPRGDSTGFGPPAVLETPVLLVSGALDPNTPPRWGDDAMRTLSESRHVIVRYGTHNFGNLRGCVDVLIRTFVEAGSARSLDTSCADRIRFPAFVTERQPSEVPLSGEALRAFEGTYRKRIPPIAVSVVPLGEVLRATLGRRTFTLVHTGENRFRVEGAPGNRVEFDLQGGRAVRMRFQLQGRRVSLTRR